ncbi:hypothetical protein M422DRAFT_43187 [Sphaerobolus stellatus SS14]|nr:hypothetical protein M422DRAFT_43187 [Sphaerobolus stellatus SS14]
MKPILYPLTRLSFPPTSMQTTGIATGFNSLPVEIIKTIFEIRQEFPLTLVNGYQSMGFWEHAASENINRRSVLIQVSKTWKNIIESTPSMWTTIPVNVCTNSLSYAEECVSRSSPLPIDLFFVEREGGAPDGASRMLREFVVFLAVGNHISRLRVLINFLDDEILKGVMALKTLFLAGTKKSTTLPFLQLLAAASGPYSLPVVGINDFPTRIHCPALDTLIFHGHVTALTQLLDPSTLARITCLDLNHANSRFSFTVLQHCVNLRRFSYAGKIPDGYLGSTSLATPIALPMVEVFSAVVEEEVGRFWPREAFIMPKLADLAYAASSAVGRTRATLDVVGPIFSTTITQLELCATVLYGTEDTALTPHYPKLQTLVIFQSYIGYGFFQTLNGQNASGSPFFPLLREIIFIRLEDMEFSLLASFIKERKTFYSDTRWSSVVKIVFQGSSERLEEKLGNIKDKYDIVIKK